MDRVCQATGAAVQSTCSDIQDRHLGTCGSFEERQIGGERFNLFSECPKAKTCTLVLRGGAEQFIAEVERSLHDAIMIVKRALRNTTIVAGGGACELELSGYLHRYADRNVPYKQQAVVKAFAKALEVIPRQLCDNAGFDATDILNRLRVEHYKGNTWAGVDFDHEGVRDNMVAFVWEPSLVKVNAIQAAVEAACLILSVDETISKFYLMHPCALLFLEHWLTSPPQKTRNLLKPRVRRVACRLVLHNGLLVEAVAVVCRDDRFHGSDDTTEWIEMDWTAARGKRDENSQYLELHVAASYPQSHQLIFGIIDSAGGGLTKPHGMEEDETKSKTDLHLIIIARRKC